MVTNVLTSLIAGYLYQVLSLHFSCLSFSIISKI